MTRLVFSTAVESPGSSREDLAWGPGCDRHVAIQGRLDIMEEVMRAGEEGIVNFMAICQALCSGSSGNAGQCLFLSHQLTLCSNYDVRLSDVLHPTSQEALLTPELRFFFQVGEGVSSTIKFCGIAMNHNLGLINLCGGRFYLHSWKLLNSFL